MRTAIDNLFSPAMVFAGWFAALSVLYLGRRWFVRPVAAAMLLAALAALVGVSLGDRRFAAVATAPDNIAVVVMLCLLAFFTWLATAQAVENDRRISRGAPVREKEFDRKVFTWPDLVCSELICMIVVTTLLLAWSLLLPAPLQQPTNPAVTPNPSKAPWYFLGLQELLFHGDAWLARLVVPGLIVVGLMALPYLDRNSRGSGYYTIRQRRFIYLAFQFGWWLSVLLILVGAFLRGPNWELHGPYGPEAGAEDSRQ
jgi:quinol-cytochrome oxidoreductase complex cytochrome b subunit